MSGLKQINQSIMSCHKCPRLMDWQEHINQNKRASYKNEAYWSKPVPSFGDAQAQLLILGLAPGAHGANRTGRLITGDSSGDWLFRSMYAAGFCNQALSKNRHDGLKLNNAWISNIIHCAPPDNKPKIEERDRCLNFLEQELLALTQLQTIVCLGQYAYDSLLKALKLKNLAQTPKPKIKFKHGQTVSVKPHTIICSYHPSQQNTFTKRLTQSMLDDIFKAAKKTLV